MPGPAARSALCRQILVADQTRSEAARDKSERRRDRGAYGLEDRLLRLRSLLDLADLVAQRLSESLARPARQLVHSTAESSDDGVDIGVRATYATRANAASYGDGADREHRAKRADDRGGLAANEVARIHILADAGPQLAQIDVQARAEIG